MPCYCDPSQFWEEDDSKYFEYLCKTFIFLKRNLNREDFIQMLRLVSQNGDTLGESKLELKLYDHWVKDVNRLKKIPEGNWDIFEKMIMRECDWILSNKSKL